MSESNSKDRCLQLDSTLTKQTSITTKTPLQESQPAKTDVQSPVESGISPAMGQCLCREGKQKASAGGRDTQVGFWLGNTPNLRKKTADDKQTESNHGNQFPNPVVEDVGRLEERTVPSSNETASDVTQLAREVTKLSLQQNVPEVEDDEQRIRDSITQIKQVSVNEASRSAEIGEGIIAREALKQEGEQRKEEFIGCNQDGGNVREEDAEEGISVGSHCLENDILDAVLMRNSGDHDFSDPAIKNDAHMGSGERNNVPFQEEQSEPLAKMDRIPHKVIQIVLSGSGELLSQQLQETQDQAGVFHETHERESFPGSLASECRRKISVSGKFLHDLLRNPSRVLSCHPSISVTSLSEATEIDVLYPNAIDGPELRFSTNFRISDLQSLIMLAISSLQVLRLPRLRSGKNNNVEELFSKIANVPLNSSKLSELVFEDNGVIPSDVANSLFDSNCLQKVEVYAPRSPVLRALTSAPCPLKDVCFHALIPNLRKELSIFLYKHGRSLESLRLGFDLSIHDEPARSAQSRFWKQMISNLDYAVPATLSQLHTLELLTSPSYQVKHRFNSTVLGRSFSATEKALKPIQELMNQKCRIRHPKEAEISLTNIKLTGGDSMVTEALRGLSWVNQGMMGVHVEIPGVCAVFQRGYGGFTPVVLQSVQLDQFIFNRVSSRWLEVTALKEIDLGEEDFVDLYNTGDISIREATRRLVINSRESLSKVRAYYQMPTRLVVMNTAKILGEIIALAPFVTHLELSRDIIRHVDVDDNEYVEGLMKLRLWNLKTFHLHSAKNYNTLRRESIPPKQASSTERGYSMEASPAGRFVVFLKRLPTFLTILSMACPRLENLVLEWEEMPHGVDMKTMKELTAAVLKALDVYETTVPSVNAATVRWLLQEWYDKCVEDDNGDDEGAELKA